MRILIQLIAGITVFTTAMAFAAETDRHNFKPKEGFVPDAKTAITIAVAVWTPIYGEETIMCEKPYKARLADGVWIVEGSLPVGRMGGVAVAEISKDDGKILRVSHGK